MRGVSGLAAFAAATIGIAAFTVTPAAAVGIHFDVDTGAATSVLLSNHSNPTHPVTAAIASTILPSFDLNSIGDSVTLDFITWTSPLRIFSTDSFNVTASLAFSSSTPSGATTTTGNGNGFGLTILGAFVAGSLVWTSGVPNTFFLIDGSGITVDFQGGQSLLLNHSITTHATVTWTSAAEVPLSTTPLPAALPLFVSGLGAMGLFGWRRKRKTQAAVA